MAETHLEVESNAIGVDSDGVLPLTPVSRSPEALEDRSKAAITGMQDASACLNDLVRVVEKYGVICTELQKLCQEMGLQCHPATIEETFTRIQRLFIECKQMAESERLQRNESQAFTHHLRQTLDHVMQEKSKYEAIVQRQEQEIVHHTEIVQQLEEEARRAQQEMENLECRLMQDLEDERTDRSEVQKAYLDAENKAIDAECARMRAESMCHDAVAALDDQHTRCLQSEQEKELLKQQIQQLELAKQKIEELYDKFYEDCEGLCEDRDDLSTLLILDKKRRASESFMVSTPSLSPMQTPVEGASESEYDQGHRSQGEGSVAFSRRMMPTPSNHTEDGTISRYTLQSRNSRSSSNLQEIREDVPRQRPRQDIRRRPLPQSVVSGQALHHLIGHRRLDGRHYFVARTPMDAAHLVLHSESSDSAEGTGSEINDGSAAARVFSYDYGYNSSLPTSTEDYDSVNEPIERSEFSNGINPLLWLWERKSNWMGGVRSGVSTAAKSGAKMSKSLLTWAVVAAVTVGSVSINKAGMINAACFDSSDSEDEDVDDTQLDTQVQHFMG